MTKQLKDLSHLWAGHPSADIQQSKEAKRQAAPAFSIGHIGSVGGNIVIVGEASKADLAAMLSGRSSEAGSGS
jgi:hypothetical protein